jgi:hypothetical protein
VVSGDLRRLVNELCETRHEQPLLLRSDAGRRKGREISAILQGTAGRQRLKIGDRLTGGNILFAVRY